METGDYFREDSDYDLYSAVLRLQNYAQTLRNKLETEKLWLATLKSETQLLLAQKGAPFPEGYHLPQCPMSKKVSTMSLRVESRSTSLPHLTQARAHKIQNTRTSYNPTYFNQNPSYRYENPADTNSNTNIHYPTSLEMQNLIERQNYLQRLAQLDTLCKEEMARVSQVSYELEPLKQLASDWDFQAELEKPKPIFKDIINKAMAEEDQNVTQNSHLFVQSSSMKETNEKPIETSVYQYLDSTNSTRIWLDQETKHNFPQLQFEEEGLANLDEKNENKIDMKPVAFEQHPEVQERPVESTKSISGKTISHPKENSSDPEPLTTVKFDTPKLENKCNPKSVKEDIKSKNRTKNEVTPIVWGRLAVDKKKKRLKRPRSSSKTGKLASDLSSEDLGSCAYDEDSNSVDNHCTTAVECEFLRKYMFTDSDYIYSPLFVSESEES